MGAKFYVTEAPNDRELARALGSLAITVPLEHGDVVFYGITPGPCGEAVPIRVCIERKKPRDMSKCILEGRYLHQVQLAKDAGMDRLVLLLEALELRENPETGLLEEPHFFHNGGSKMVKEWTAVIPEITYSRFDQYLDQLHWFAGIQVKRSTSLAETAAIVRGLWVTFQDLPENHSSLKVIYEQPAPTLSFLQRPGIVRRVAKEIDGIGWEKSRDVAARFKSVREMVMATEKNWREIPGIGKKISKVAVTTLNEEEKKE